MKVSLFLMQLAVLASVSFIARHESGAATAFSHASNGLTVPARSTALPGDMVRDVPPGIVLPDITLALPSIALCAALVLVRVQQRGAEIKDAVS